MIDPKPELQRVGERALLVRFPDADLSRAVARAHALAGHLRRVTREDEGSALDPTSRPELEGEERTDERLAVKGEWILGAGNLIVRLDEFCAAREVETLARAIEESLAVLSVEESPSSGRAFTVNVRFGHEEGPDLAAVAREAELAEAEVVARFCAAEHMVAFVGFSPGFPYLIGLPPELEVPRLAEPRTGVPAGSVAIAGPFAGVYPSATPGGWRLLGRSDALLFDPAADPPACLAPGDRVRFVAR